MCSQKLCGKCLKLSYTGCGNHLANIFDGMSKDKICVCNVTPQLQAYFTKRGF